MYRELLNTQLQYNKDMQGYGNMTNIEKKMNREDLIAYKNYDNTQYALIPGVNNQKNFMDSNIYQPKTKTIDMDEKHKRL